MSDQSEIEKLMRNAVNNIEKIGKLYAIAKGTSYHMQEMKKVVLAREMKKYKGSSASREMEARASERYEQHLDGTRQAIEDETRLRAEYERWKAQYESCRSLLSLEKAKTRIL